MSDAYDLVVIGGGPGGYVCAIRAAQLGLRTAIVEKRPTLGGTCVNVGCIPSKALLDSSEKFHAAQHEFGEHGIQLGKVGLDLSRMMARKDKVVKELTDGLNFLMGKNKITVIQGTGSFRSAAPGDIRIAVAGGAPAEVVTRNCVIATGSDVVRLPGIETDGRTIITSDEAIALDRVPEHMVIIGAGVIGLELGSVWKRLGAKVTVVELLPGILWGIDRQTRELAERTLAKQGLEFIFEHKVVGAEIRKGLAHIRIEGKDGAVREMDCDRLLVAVGRRPYTDGLNAEAAGVKLNARRRVEVNPHTLETSVPGIFAIGDVIDGPMLAHKAEEEGVMVAENLAGRRGHVNYDAIPGVVYTWPEIAWVGKGEEELAEAGVAFRVGKFLFRANGRAKAMLAMEGQIKIIADEKTDRILGVHMVGPNVSELIAEGVLAMEFGASAEDLARTCHGHPTLSEVTKEAALAVDKRTIHA